MLATLSCQRPLYMLRSPANAPYNIFIYMLRSPANLSALGVAADKVSSSSPAGVSAFTCRGASDVVSLGLKNSCADGARCSVARCELFDCCLRRATT